MRCSQARIHSALPFTAPPLLFVCRLPPIFIATQPVTNTVGYQAINLNGGANTFVVQTLLPCGVAKENVTLADFKPTDGENGWDYARDYVATLNVNGTLKDKYGYLSPYWEDEYYAAGQSGWYDYAVLQPDPDEITAEKIDATKIPFGTGFLVYTSKANVTITFAGEVLQDDIALGLNGGANTFVGNVTPATLQLNKLVATDGANGWDYARDYLATLNTNGTLKDKYGYLSPYWEDEYYAAGQSGWYDYAVLQPDPDEISAEKVGDEVVFSAGDGFLIYTSKANVELLVPSAL